VNSLRYVRVFAIVNPSVVCNVCAPYPGVETFRNMSSPFCTLAILYLREKFYKDRPTGTPPSGVLNARGVAKWSDGGSIESYNLINDTRHGLGYN